VPFGGEHGSDAPQVQGGTAEAGHMMFRGNKESMQWVVHVNTQTHVHVHGGMHGGLPAPSRPSSGPTAWECR
jgi:hypothetical protein